jgi:hypothetical protein
MMLVQDDEILGLLERRLGRLHARQRLGIEKDHEAQVRGVARLVGIEGGVVSGVINLESSGV